MMLLRRSKPGTSSCTQGKDKTALIMQNLLPRPEGGYAWRVNGPVILESLPLLAQFPGQCAAALQPARALSSYARAARSPLESRLPPRHGRTPCPLHRWWQELVHCPRAPC